MAELRKIHFRLAHRAYACGVGRRRLLMAHDGVMTTTQTTTNGLEALS